MSERKDGGSAFARITEIMTPNSVDHQSPKWSRVRGEPGMSLRDYFAGQALAGMLSNGFMPSQYGMDVQSSAKPWDWAKAAYAVADDMLEAREPKP